MLLKNISYALLLCSLFACEQTTPKEVPVSSFEIDEDTSKLASMTNFQDFEQLLATEKGKVVLVNIWATWCKPCVHEMPFLEKLHQNYQDKGVKIVTLSIDDVAKADSLVVPFWEEMNFSMDNYLVTAEDTGAFINKIDPLWIGLLPTTFIFNGNGEKVESITGTMTYKGFEKKMLNVLNAVN